MSYKKEQSNKWVRVISKIREKSLGYEEEPSNSLNTVSHCQSQHEKLEAELETRVGAQDEVRDKKYK